MWTQDLHLVLLRLTGLMSRSSIDSAFLSRSNLKLDRALFPLLVRIGSAPSISVGELADMIGRDHSTVSRQVSKLEKLGLVERSPASDQRMRTINSTPAGTGLLADIAAARRRVLEEAFAEWDRPELERAIASLSAICDSLHAATAAPD